MSDVLTELEQLLSDLPTAVAQRKFGENLAKANTSLASAADRIKRIEVLREIAECLDYASEARRRDKLNEVLELAWDVGNQLEEADDVTALDKAIFAYERDLQRELNELDRDLRARWDDIVQRQFRSLIPIGDLLNRLLSQSNLGSQMANCGRSAIAVQDGTRASEFLATVRQLLADYGALQAERENELGDGDVALFINALAGDRATLHDVTDEVWDWLEEHGSLDVLKIRPL